MLSFTKTEYTFLRLKNCVALILATAALLATTATIGDDSDNPKPNVRRRGAFMGMDPGLAFRFDETGTPLYARLDIRIGGCFSPRVQLGADLRMDLLVSGEDGAWDKRQELGPVLAIFLLKGWFVRMFVHIAAFDPFAITAGGQTGYEFSIGKFSAIGLAVGGDVDTTFDGASPYGYSIAAVLYLSAYDLGTRRGREF